MDKWKRGDIRRFLKRLQKYKNKIGNEKLILI